MYVLLFSTFYMHLLHKFLPSQAVTPTTVPSQVQQPSARLLCTNLPQEVTDDVLSVLFQQYVFAAFPVR